ncbi:hypothetical protein JCM30204_51890 [Dysgonomonas termitidis]
MTKDKIEMTDASIIIRWNEERVERVSFAFLIRSFNLSLLKAQYIIETIIKANSI